MDYIPYAIIPIVIVALFFAIKESVAKAEKNMGSNCFTVRPSKIFLWIGIICVLLFGGIIVFISIYPNDSVDVTAYLIFSFFLLLGMLLILYYLNWKVRVNGDEICCHSLFRRTKTFTFHEIKGYRIQGENPQKIESFGGEGYRITTLQTSKCILYSETKKILTIESNCNGYNVFVARLKKAHIKPI